MATKKENIIWKTKFSESSSEPSACSPVMIQALQIYSFTFGRLPPTIVELLSKNGKFYLEVVPCSSISSLRSLLAFVSSAAIMVGSSLYLLLKAAFLPSSETVPNPVLTISAVVWISLFWFLFRMAKSIHGSKGSVCYFNKQIWNEALQNFKFEKSPNKFDMIGLLFLGFILSAVLLEMCLALISTALGLNPVGAAMEQLLFPDPHSRPVWKNLLVVLVPFTIQHLAFTFALKYLWLSLAYPTLICVSVKLYLQKLLKYGSLSEDGILFKFRCLSVIGQINKNFMSEYVESLAGFYQVLLCSMGWLGLRCYSVLPTIIVFMIWEVLVSAIIMMRLFLHNAADCRVVSGALIRRKKRRFRIANRNSVRYYYAIKWRAQQPLPIYCGQYFSLSRRAILIYLDVFINNLTTAIIAVRP